jgi:hypothetical protein
MSDAIASIAGALAFHKSNMCDTAPPLGYVSPGRSKRSQLSLVP